MTSGSNKEKIAGKIANAILKVQAKAADRMNAFRYLKLFLIVFCITAGSLSIYFFVDAIITKPKSRIKIDRIRSPRPAYETPQEMYDEKIPEEVYRNIQEYRRYMDSTGQMISPGLADSIRMLEEMYLQQLK